MTGMSIRGHGLLEVMVLSVSPRFDRSPLAIRKPGAARYLPPAGGFLPEFLRVFAEQMVRPSRDRRCADPSDGQK